MANPFLPNCFLISFMENSKIVWSVIYKVTSCWCGFTTDAIIFENFL